jgi:hypothetical protein
MIAVNPNSICKQAQAYYYEYLCGEDQEYIPAEILAHIDKCHFCQAEVDRLRIMLAEAEEHATESTGRTSSAAITNLRLHFAYAGVPVTCNIAKPFLPSLVIPALEVGVPTPITVHLDKCQQCANDLEVIRQLNLTNKQLCRSSQLLADKPAEPTVSCSEARAAILGVGFMHFHKANAEVLKHLCTCPDCREQLYQFRDKVRMEWLDEERTENRFPCEEVSTTDIFDYCFPYGIDPANDQYAKFRESLTLHLCSCPICLGKMQQLHQTVYNIAERPDSEVVTCFTLEEHTGQEVLDKSSIEYETSSTSICSPRLLKQRVLTLNLKRYIKPVAVAAAVILVVLVLVNAPVAKAVDLGQIYKALGQIRNVYFAAFVPEKTEPTQEIWVSQALNTMISKTNTTCVLWDIKSKSRKSRDLNTGSITVTELDNDALVKIDKTMTAPWGLLPFDDISKVPPDAKWQQVADEDFEITVPDTEVYDLVWTEKKLDGSVVYNKWRGYIDTETKLPKRIERWEKGPKEEDKLITVTQIAYPTIVEVRAALKDAGL